MTSASITSIASISLSSWRWRLVASHAPRGRWPGGREEAWPAGRVGRDQPPTPAGQGDRGDGLDRRRRHVAGGDRELRPVRQGPRRRAGAAWSTPSTHTPATTRWVHAASPAAGALPPTAEQDVIRTEFIYNPNTVQPVGPSTICSIWRF